MGKRGLSSCALALVVLATLCVSACSSSNDKPSGGSLADLGIDDGASKGESTSALVTGKEAVVLELSTGAQVKIPAGAVDEELTVGLKRPADPEALGLLESLSEKQSIASAPYVVTPHGTQFKTSVEVTLPIAKDRDAKKLKVAWLEDEEDTEWKQLGVPETSGDKAKIAIDHFSVLVLIESDEAVPTPGDDAGAAPAEDGSVQPGEDGSVGPGVDTVEATVSVSPAAAAEAGGLSLDVNGQAWELGNPSNTRSFAASSNGEYAVSLTASATGYDCVLEGSEGVRDAAALRSLQVTCELRAYAVTGTLTGAPSSVTLLYSGSIAGELLIATDGAFTLPATLSHGASLAFQVEPSSAGIACSVTPSSLSSVTTDVELTISCSAVSGVLATVQDFLTGEPVGGAVARVLLPTGHTQTATSQPDGSLHLDVPEGLGVVVRLDREGYAPQFIRLPDTQEERLLGASWPLNPLGAQLSFDPAQAQVFSVPGSSAELHLPANALVDAAGQPFTGSAELLIAPIDPSADLATVPGGLITLDSETSATRPIETLALLDVRFRSSAGQPLTLAPEVLAMVRIPVASRASEPPDSMPLYHYDESLGHWVALGEATLSFDEGAGSYYYEGSIDHFAAWSAARVLETVLYTSCLVDLNGNPVSDALIQAAGVSYLSATTARSDAAGMFSIPVGANASFNVSSLLPVQSRVVSVESGAEDFANDSCLQAADAEIRVTLTWGAEPLDLDLHILGEDFHVYHSSTNAQVGNTQVWLDTDQTNGNGPEVISAGRLPAGRYRVVVHHYDGSSTITESPARLRLQAPGIDSVFVPSQNADTSGDFNSWIALDLVVSGAGSLSVSPVDLFTGLDAITLSCPDPSAPEPLECAIFTCASGDQSITRGLYCNGELDCTDGSDENTVDCPDTVFACSSEQFISYTSYCNGYWDCPDGVDENNGDCPDSSFVCGDGGTVPTDYVCDGSWDCDNGADEPEGECDPNVDAFDCGDGTLIDFSFVCDGFSHCPNDADESNCLTQ